MADDPGSEAPPVLGRWRNAYLLVLTELVALITIFWALTWWAA